MNIRKLKFPFSSVRRRGRRGSAILTAILLTVLLFIFGFGFLITSRSQREVVSSVDTYNALDASIRAVIDQINMVLITDLFGNNDKKLLNATSAAPDSDEYWDYPKHTITLGANLFEDQTIDAGGDDILGTADDGLPYFGKMDDAWLADLEPSIVPVEFQPASNPTHIANVAGFAHISDIYGRLAYLFQDSYDFVTTHALKINYWDSYSIGDRISFRNLRASIVNPADPIRIEGDRADADGDGVADSRWVIVPDIVGPQGQEIYTAVRIIDNCAMLNINTAYRDPTGLATPGPWDGSRLAHINLEGIRYTSELVGVADFQKERFGTVANITGSPSFLDYPNDYDNDVKYDDDVAQRVLNPAIVNISGVDYYFSPFDISDELELRNRFFLTSPVNCRFGYYDYINSIPVLWQNTFDPLPTGLTPGRKYPYGTNITDTIGAWFDKAQYTIGSLQYYNRRHIATTYSFDRLMVPWQDITSAMPPILRNNPNGWYAWTKWDQPQQDQWTYRPICVNDYDLAHPTYDPVNWPTKPTLEQIAAAIWLGLPNDPVALNALPQFFGFVGWTPELIRERLACQMAANLADYIDSDYVVTDFNPGGGADHYYGYEAAADHPYIARLGVSRYNDTSGGPPGVPHIHYAISIFFDKAPAAASGWKINVNGTTTLILPDMAAGTVLVADTTTPGTFGFTGADGAIPFITAGFQFTDGDRIVLLDPMGRPCDVLTVGGVAAVLSAPLVDDQRYVYHSNLRDGKTIGDIGTYHIVAWDVDGLPGIWPGPFTPAPLIGQLLVPSPPGPVTAAIQVGPKDSPLVTLGEFCNVIAAGAMNIGGVYHSMQECWDNILDAPGAGGDIAVTEVDKGRLDITNEAFANITRYLTVFHPFSDKVDNDGNGRNDDPAHDNIDNDHNGITDTGDINETFANYGEFTELAVAGRININTAPWFVIAQLPWVQDPALPVADQLKLARAIVAYRDKQAIDGLVDYNQGGSPISRGLGINPISPPTVRENLGFANIGELLNITNNLANTFNDAAHLPYDIRSYGRDEDPPGTAKHNNQAGEAPFYSTDSAANDLMERNIIFQRISNLVTVRSDVFTAYILVRVGRAGPQRRVIAILDRGNVFGPTDTPKLVALHPVPDPR